MCCIVSIVIWDPYIRSGHDAIIPNKSKKAKNPTCQFLAVWNKQRYKFITLMHESFHFQAQKWLPVTQHYHILIVGKPLKRHFVTNFDWWRHEYSKAHTFSWSNSTCQNSNDLGWILEDTSWQQRPWVFM